MPTLTEAPVAAAAPPTPSDVREKARGKARSAASHGVYVGPSLLLPQPSGSRRSARLNTLEKHNTQRGILDSTRGRT
jgi:hypothetical protein